MGFLLMFWVIILFIDFGDYIMDVCIIVILIGFSDILAKSEEV